MAESTMPQSLPQNAFAPLTQQQDIQALTRPSLSYWQDAWIRLKANRRAIISLYLVLGLLVYCRATGRGLRLAHGDRWRAFGLGLLMSMMFYGNVGAVEFISVGLTALLFYTFPPIVGVMESVIDLVESGGAELPQRAEGL